MKKADRKTKLGKGSCSAIMCTMGYIVLIILVHAAAKYMLRAKLCLITLGRKTLGDMLGYTLCPVLNIRPDKPVALKYVPPTVGGFNLSFHAESHVNWIAGRDP
ncbi:hypothetical protein HRR82_004613 [Exophiala dermatitidis]|nr:hypothetical protein HRR79_008564 [Exophiala dermatitidis]KAJ4579467.1 hypothetical protein HRR82_004613 [Exophiala dermatitidis]KAJ4608783.1 hypothetical protein HRR85_007122 [Exophiala dermatitidis]